VIEPSALIHAVPTRVQIVCCSPALVTNSCSASTLRVGFDIIDLLAPATDIPSRCASLLCSTVRYPVLLLFVGAS